MASVVLLWENIRGFCAFSINASTKTIKMDPSSEPRNSKSTNPFLLALIVLLGLPTVFLVYKSATNVDAKDLEGYGRNGDSESLVAFIQDELESNRASTPEEETKTLRALAIQEIGKRRLAGGLTYLQGVYFGKPDESVKKLILDNLTTAGLTREEFIFPHMIRIAREGGKGGEVKRIFSDLRSEEGDLTIARLVSFAKLYAPLRVAVGADSSFYDSLVVSDFESFCQSYDYLGNSESVRDSTRQSFAEALRYLTPHAATALLRRFNTLDSVVRKSLDLMCSNPYATRTYQATLNQLPPIQRFRVVEQASKQNDQLRLVPMELRDPFIARLSEDELRPRVSDLFHLATDYQQYDYSKVDEFDQRKLKKAHAQGLADKTKLQSLLRRFYCSTERSGEALSEYYFDTHHFIATVVSSSIAPAFEVENAYDIEGSYPFIRITPQWDPERLVIAIPDEATAQRFKHSSWELIIHLDVDWRQLRDPEIIEEPSRQLRGLLYEANMVRSARGLPRIDEGNRVEVESIIGPVYLERGLHMISPMYVKKRVFGLSAMITAIELKSRIVGNLFWARPF